MVPDRQKVRTDGRNGRKDDTKTISLQLRRGIKIWEECSTLTYSPGQRLINQTFEDKENNPFKSMWPGPEVIKLFSCSTEHKISTAHKNKNAKKDR